MIHDLQETAYLIFWAFVMLGSAVGVVLFMLGAVAALIIQIILERRF